MRTTRRPLRHRLATAALLLVVGAAATACDGDAAGATGLPDGWTLVERETFAIGAPPDWTVEDVEPGVVDLVGPDGPLDSRVRVRAGVPEGVTAEESFRVVTLGMQFELRDVELDEDPEPWSPAGAADGAIGEVAYAQTVDGDEVRLRELTAVATGETVQVVLRAVDREERFDEVRDTLRTIIDTLEVRDGAVESEQQA